MTFCFPYRADAVRKEIQDETDRMTGKTKQISPVPIHLSVYSPNGIYMFVLCCFMVFSLIYFCALIDENDLFYCSCQLDFDRFAWFDKGCHRYFIMKRLMFQMVASLLFFLA